MSRWGFAALVAAFVAVIAIGMVAIRVSDRSSTASGTPASPSVSPDATASAQEESRSVERDTPPTTVASKRMRSKPVGRQVRWLERKGASRGRGGGEDFFVTLSLRKPIPLRLVSGRRSPLPNGLSDATVYSLYAESKRGRPYRTRADDLTDAGGKKRTVVTGMSVPFEEYRDLQRRLRSLPVESHVASTSAMGADYVPGDRLGKRALRSWNRFYRRS